jgi:hypothetical protein
MGRSVTGSCSAGVSLFKGFYGRVARDLGVDASYISRVARGERKSKVVEKALIRELKNIVASIKNSSAQSAWNRRMRTLLGTFR